VLVSETPGGHATYPDSLSTLLVGVLSSTVRAVLAARAALTRPPDRPAEAGGPPLPPLPALDVTIDLSLRAAAVAASGIRFASRTLGPVIKFAIDPPLVGHQLSPHSALETMAARGRMERIRAERFTGNLVDKVVPAVVSAVLDRIDLTDIIVRADIGEIVSQLDLNAIVGQVDLDVILANLDLDAIIARLDLAGIVNQVITEIDLPDIIRESSGTMASEAVVGMRLQGFDADERVNRIVDRILLRRRQDRATANPPSDDGSG
jgi:hypothetical protein